MPPGNVWTRAARFVVCDPPDPDPALNLISIGDPGAISPSTPLYFNTHQTTFDHPPRIGRIPPTMDNGIGDTDPRANHLQGLHI